MVVLGADTRRGAEMATVTNRKMPKTSPSVRRLC